MASIRLRRRGLDSVKDICDITGISVPTLYRSWALYARTGSFVKARLLGLGRPRKVYHRDAQYLLHLARYNPTTFLDEYRAMLDKNRHLSLHISTIHRVFLRAGLSVKRVQKMAKERDPVKQADYIRRIGAYSPVCLIFIDEVSKNDRVYARLWGRSRVGERVECSEPFVRGRRVSMLAGMALDKGITAAKVIEGSYTTEEFMKFLREDLVCFDFPIRSSPLMWLCFIIASSYDTVSWAT